jgi:hypothetical protein
LSFQQLIDAFSAAEVHHRKETRTVCVVERVGRILGQVARDAAGGHRGPSAFAQEGVTPRRNIERSRRVDIVWFWLLREEAKAI